MSDLDSIKRLIGDEVMYVCPKKRDGTRIGQLVVYAGTYETEAGLTHNFVGDVYVNCGILERQPTKLQKVAGVLIDESVKPLLKHPDLNFCGIPMGGNTFAYALALEASKFTDSAGYIYLETKEIPKPDGKKPEKQFFFGRHAPAPGSNIILVEDVLNNFSSTKKVIKVVEEAGANIVGIAGIVNRSLTVDIQFEAFGRMYPVFSAIRVPIDEWRQDDEKVADDVAKNNIEWHPKANFNKLKALMAQHA